MSDAVGSSRIRLTVAWSPSAGKALEVEVEVAADANVIDAVRAAGIDIGPGLGFDIGDTRSVGIWGRACSLDTAVRDGDRVEIYRPLQVDAMEARRRRAAKR